MYITQIDGYK